MQLLITGADGMLGTAVQRKFSGVIAYPFDHKSLDVTDYVAVEATLDRLRPTTVLHLAAWTDVDGCQREPERAMAVNGQATAFLAEACARRGIRLVYVSTIAVFDGRQKRPYRERDRPAPINVYGASKLLGEQAVRQSPANVVVRSGWLFGGGRRDRKFVGLIRRLSQEREVIHVVDDCVGSPTYVDDLAAGLRRLLLEARAAGVYHLVNGGAPASRLQMAACILSHLDAKVRLEPVASDFFPQLAPRPAMEAAASDRVNGWLRSWPAALAEYMASL